MKKMSAITLRNLLTILLILVFVITGGGFYYAFGRINDYATTVNQAVVSAHTNTGSSASATTQQLTALLAKETTVTSTLDKFYASSSSFQAQAIQDITTYAHDSNLAIGNVTLDSSTGAAGHPLMTVPLKTPVSYTSLLKFMSYIQNSLPKMQIQGVTLSHINNGSADSVTVTSITVEVVTQA